MNRNTGERDSLGRAIRETPRGRRYVLDAQGRQQRPAGEAKRKREENNARRAAENAANVQGSQDLFVRAIVRLIRTVMTQFKTATRQDPGYKLESGRVGQAEVTVTARAYDFRDHGRGEIRIDLPSGLKYLADFDWLAPGHAGHDRVLPQTHYGVELAASKVHGGSAGSVKDVLDRVARAAVDRYNATPVVVNRNRAATKIQRAFRARVRRPAPSRPKVFLVLRKDLEDDLAVARAPAKVSDRDLRVAAAVLTRIGETAIRKVHLLGLPVRKAMDRATGWADLYEYRDRPKLTPGYKLGLTDQQSSELMDLLSRYYTSSDLSYGLPLGQRNGLPYRKEDLSRAFADDHAVPIQAAARGMLARRKAAELLNKWYEPDGPGFHAAMRRLKGRTPGTNEYLIDTMRNSPARRLVRSASAAALTTPAPKKRAWPKGSNAALLNAMPLNPRLFAHRPRARNA